MNAAFRDDVTRECVEALKRYGFTEFRKGWISREINDDFSCWVGLSSGIFRDGVSMYPQVGVHASRLDRLVAELRSDPAIKYDRHCASYSLPLLELAPSEPAFRFTSSASMPTTADRLAQLYDRVGFPFSQSIGSNEALLPRLEEYLPMLGGYPERYAACLFSMGRKSEAIEYARTLAEAEPHIRPFCTRFIQYCRSDAT